MLEKMMSSKKIKKKKKKIRKINLLEISHFMVIRNE